MNIKKIDIYYIVTLLFILVSANASFLSSSNICWFGSTIFMLIVALQKKLLSSKDLKVIAIFSLVYLLFVAIRDVLINGLELDFLVSDIVFLFKIVFLSYIFCIVLKDKAAAYLIKVIVHLTVLSLCFYLLQLLSLGDYIYKFSTSLGLPSDNTIPGYTNFVFFTFVKGFHDYRNSGFSWEPGAFGAFLIIALLLNLFLNNFKFEKKSYILIAGIFTTLATTDYLALMLVLFLAYRVRVPKITLKTVSLIAIFVAVIIFIPFLGSKIKDVYYEDLSDLNKLRFLDLYYRHNKMQIPLDRFSSMVILYDTFDIKLLLGVSNKYDIILDKLVKANVNISNGVFDFLTKFGLVGFVYLVYRYSKFCIAQVVKVEYLLYCILILFVVGFGEPLLVLPIILMFIFIDRKQRRFKRRIKGLPEELEDEAEREKPGAFKAELAKFRRV